MGWNRLTSLFMKWQSILLQNIKSPFVWWRFSGYDLPNHSIFRCFSGDMGAGTLFPFSYRYYFAGSPHDLLDFPRTIFHHPSGKTFFLCVGASSLPPSTGRAGTGSFCFGPHFICTWKSCHCGGPCWISDLAYGQPDYRRRKPVVPVRRISGPSWPCPRHGRSYPDGLYSGIPCQ